jgi:hypothetical protein
MENSLSEEALNQIDPELVWASYAHKGRALLAALRCDPPSGNSQSAVREWVVNVWLKARKVFGDPFPASQSTRQETWRMCAETLDRAWAHAEERLAELSGASSADLYRFVTDLILTLAHHYARRELEVRIGCWMYEMPPEQRLKAADVYLRRFGHYLPEVMTIGKKRLFYCRFKQTLEQHPTFVDRFDLEGRNCMHGEQLHGSDHCGGRRAQSYMRNAE